MFRLFGRVRDFMRKRIFLYPLLAVIQVGLVINFWFIVINEELEIVELVGFFLVIGLLVWLWIHIVRSLMHERANTQKTMRVPFEEDGS